MIQRIREDQKKQQFTELGFEIIGTVKPSVNGKDTYQRLLIKRIPPKEKVISICELCKLWETDSSECENCEIEVVIVGEEI
ncbi:MAG: hypothetical protein LBP69_06470 [Treponema sp.]|jgi:hypothetical protein|nr:hypothetical protein [Treponema sp.]